MDAVPHDSLDGLTEQCPGSVELLSLLAFWADEPVATGVLTDSLDRLPTAMAEVVVDPKRVESLQREIEPGDVLTVHDDTLALSADAAAQIRGRLDEGERRRWCTLGMEVLRASFPEEADDYSDWAACEELLPHLIALVDHATALGVADDSASWLLDRAAVHLYSRGEYARATDLSTRALASATLAADDPLLGTLHHTFGRLLGEHGELSEARKEIGRALEIHQGLEPGDVRVRRDRVSLAEIFSDEGEWEAAREQLNMALEDRSGGAADRCDCSARCTLAWMLNDKGELEAARTAYGVALELCEQVLGPEHPDTADAHSGLGVVLGGLGEFEPARRELERALEITEATLGARHPEAAVVRSNLSGILQGLGELQGAREHLEFALDVGEEGLPGDHRGLWIRHRKLAVVLQGLGDLSEARAHAEEALEISERSVGPEDSRVEGDLKVLGPILRALGAREAARDAYLRARSIAERERGRKHRDVAGYDVWLGQVFRELGALEHSGNHLRSALQAYAEDGDSLAALVGVRIELAQLMADLGDQLVAVSSSLGRTEEADRLREQSAAAFVDQLEGERDKADVQTLIVVAEASQSRAPDFAAATLGQAQSMLEDDDSSVTRQRVGAAWHGLGRVLRGSEPETASAAFEAAVLLLDGNPSFQGVVLHDLADVKLSQGETEEAIALFRDAAAHKSQGKEVDNGRHVGSTLQVLGRTLERDGRYEDAFATYSDALKEWRSLSKRDLAVEGMILHDLGDVQRSLGKLDAAVELYRESLDLKHENDTSARSLGVTLLWLGRSQAGIGQYDGALEAYREWLDTLRSSPDPDPQVEGVVLHDIADVRKAEGRLEEAIELYREAAQSKGRGSNRFDLAITLRALARTLGAAQEYDEALAIYEEQLEILRSLPDSDLHLEGTLLHDIADVQQELGEHDAAIGLYREAAERKRESKVNPHSLIATLQALGRALERTGAFEPAIATYGEQLDVLRSLPEPDYKIEGVALHDIADVRREQGSTDEAIQLYREAVEQKRLAGPSANGRSLPLSLEALGRTIDQSGDYNEALDVLNESLELLRALEQPELGIEGTVLHDIADVRRKQGEIEEAIERYREAVECRRVESQGGASYDMVAPLQALGRTLEENEDFEAAIVTHTEQLELLRSLSEPQVQLEGIALHDIADARQALGETKQAILLYREALGLKRKADDPSHRDSIASTLQALGRALERSEDYTAALEAYQEQLEILRSLDPDPQLEGIALHDIADARQALGETKQAILLYREALGLKRKADDPSHRDSIASTLQALGRALERSEDYTAALEAYQEQLEILRSLDPDPQLEGIALHDIADVKSARGETAEAIELYRQAAESKRAAEDSTVRDLAATLLGQGSSELTLRGDPASTAAEVLELIRSETNPDLELLASALMLHGEIASGRDDREALRFFVEAREALDKDSSHDPLERASIRAMVAKTHDALGEQDEAATERAALIAILEENFADTLDECSAGSLFRLCVLCAENDGLDLARAVIAHVRKRVDDERDDSALVSVLSQSHGYLGRALERNREYADALVAYRAQLEALQLLPEPDLRVEGIVFHDMADVRGAQGETAEALELYGKAVELKRAAGEAASLHSLAISLLALGFARLEADDLAGAGTAGEEAGALIRSEEDLDEPLLAAAMVLVAAWARESRDLDRALELLSEADELIERAGPTRIFDAAMAKELLASVHEELGNAKEARAARDRIKP